MKLGKILPVSLAATFVCGSSWEADPLKIGLMATLAGTCTVLGEDGVRGLKTALAVHGEKVGGRW
ncbi:MAG: hypothetical protein KTR32_13985 [Granulosicoccus sp.]|nr:hypothetical protein [Granulosicoccus sp.]